MGGIADHKSFDLERLAARATNGHYECETCTTQRSLRAILGLNLFYSGWHDTFNAGQQLDDMADLADLIDGYCWWARS